MRSVRARAALGATVVVAVALIGAGLAVLLVLRANLTDQAGLQAEVAAREVAGQLALDVPVHQLDLPDAEEHPVQVIDEDGRLVAVSDDLVAITGTGTDRVKPQVSALPTSAGTDDDGGGDRHGGEDRGDDDANVGIPARGEVSTDDPDFTNGAATVDGDRADYRFASVSATTGAGVTLTVHAGAPLATEQRAVGSVRRAMLIGLPVMLLIVAAVTWLMTRRALRPVEGIRAEMSAITASEDLSRRVPEPGSRDEIARLARTTNETLTALEASVDRQRRFVADACTSCAARSRPCAHSWRWARPIRSCWTCPARSRTPSGSRRWQPICCCWPGWTRGSGRGAPGWTSARSSTRRSRSAPATGSRWRCPYRRRSPSKSPARVVSWRESSAICWTTRSVTRRVRSPSRCARNVAAWWSRSATTGRASPSPSVSGSSNASCAWTTPAAATRAARAWASP